MRFLTAGESHGRALVGILEGMPSNLPLTLAHLHAQLRRRKLGFGRGTRQAIETDEVEIVSGVRHGITLGSPIAVLLVNRDWDNWRGIMDVAPPPATASDGAASGGRRVAVPRPGHADRIGGRKYAHDDMRNVLERSSARETAMRVALGTVARTLLEALGIDIASRVVRVGGAVDTQTPQLPVSAWNAVTDASPARCLCADASARMVTAIEAAKANGDTLGGVFEVVTAGVPWGLGSYAHWDRRLEAEIGRAFLSLNAIKGVEVGLGFGVAERPGSAVHDALAPDGHGGARPTSNRAGGLEGGMTTGEPLVVRAAMKPLSTLMRPLASVNVATGAAAQAHVERSDVCAVPAAAVIGEALVALVLAEAVLTSFGGDDFGRLRRAVAAWRLEERAQVGTR